MPSIQNYFHNDYGSSFIKFCDCQWTSVFRCPDTGIGGGVGVLVGVSETVGLGVCVVVEVGVIEGDDVGVAVGVDVGVVVGIKLLTGRSYRRGNVPG